MPLPFGQTFDWTDILTVLILVVLEGLLSGDNALVLAVIVMPLTGELQRRALRYGIMGVYVLRIIATLLAAWLVGLKWVALVGGLYLLYLPFKHFTAHPDEEPADGTTAAAVSGFLGLSLFWTIVIKADIVDLVFAVDSILAAVGVTGGRPDKMWVIITGGLLGLTMMRLLTLQVLDLVKRYPKLIDGAYIVVAWVGVKLLFEYFHSLKVDTTLFGVHIQFDGHRWVPEIPHPVSIGIVIVLFIAAFLYARAHADAGLTHTAEDAAAMILAEEADHHPPPGDAPTNGDSSGEPAAPVAGPGTPA